MSRIEITTTIALSPRLAAKVLARFELEQSTNPRVTLDQVVESYVIRGLIGHELRSTACRVCCPTAAEKAAPPNSKKKTRRAAK